MSSLAVDLAKFGLLPLNKRKRGIRLAMFSDSIGKHNHSASLNTYISNENRGELMWCRFLDPRFTFNVVYDATKFNPPDTTNHYNGRGFDGLNCGIAGDDTALVGTPGALGRLSEVISKRPDVCIVALGTNDITADGATAATIMTNLGLIVDALRNAGIQVILFTIRPRPSSVWAVGSTNRQKQKDVNSGIRDMRGRRQGVYVFDVAKVLSDPVTGEPLSGVLDPADNLHLTPTGGYTVANGGLLALLQSIFPAGGFSYHTSADDTFDATLNPHGNLAPAISSGTAGSSANGISGSIMTGWKVQRTSGSGVVTGIGSVITDPVFGYMQQVVFTLPGGGGNEVFQLIPSSAPAASYAAGTWVTAGCYNRIPANVLIQSVDMQLRNSVNTAFSGYGMKSFDITKLPPNLDYEGWNVIEPFQVPATPGTWLFSQNVRLNGALTGTVTVKLAAGFLKAMDDPTASTNGLWG